MRKLKYLQKKHLDCVDDNEYIGIFVTAVMDYTRTIDVKKLLSWEEFEVVLRRKRVTLCLETWDRHEYAIDVILKRAYKDYPELCTYKVYIPTMPNKPFSLQINSDGYDIENDKFRGTWLQSRFDGILTIHYMYFEPVPKKLPIAEQIKKEIDRMSEYVSIYGGLPPYGILPDDF
jgi:hypothetical protein